LKLGDLEIITVDDR